jgi:hypothetical protein
MSAGDGSPGGTPAQVAYCRGDNDSGQVGDLSPMVGL